jgi:two-component system, sensor histidine kinase
MTTKHNKNSFPWWTWLLPIVIFHIGSEISALFKFAPGAAYYYLPTTMSLILVNWWGPKRVVPAVYINAVLSAHLWDITEWYYWPLFAIPETLFPLISWYLFTYKYKGDFTLPNVKSLVRFLVVGLLVPIIVEVGLLAIIFVATGKRNPNDLIFIFIRSWLGEFVSNFGLTLPVLFFLSPLILLHRNGTKTKAVPAIGRLSGYQLTEVTLIYSIILILSLSIPFGRFWFVFGVLSLYVALRFGFGLAICTNAFIFLLTYILPLITIKYATSAVRIGQDDLNIYLGTSLLYVFSALIGRVISDVEIAELKIKAQVAELEKANTELKQANEELDRFVYSVSHDLSAPLKSILGLVNVSKLTENLSEHRQYFDKIQVSVLKLNAFIKEVLDYSYNKRVDVRQEVVNIEEICVEILGNVTYLENFDRIKVDYAFLKQANVRIDKTRLKIILNNLLTNAIKYQRADGSHKPFIRISTETESGCTLIHVADNGEGIRSEMIPRIFDMFVRATDRSKGAGLGLYIAKQTCRKFGGDIVVSSEYGKGTVFTVRIPGIEPNQPVPQV